MALDPVSEDHFEYGWKGRHSVEEWLYREPWKFEFFQVVRLLELLQPDRMPPGFESDPEREVVRLHAATTFVFPASEVQSLKPPSRHEPAELTANLLPLGGAEGPLPDADSDRVIERASRKDFAMRDFLDIFHHRLLSLLVRSRKAHHPSYISEAPGHGPIAQFLFATFGLGPATLRDRMRADDRSFLFYSGILSQHPRSASGLDRMLSDYFQIPARVVQMLGQWRDLDGSEWTILGRRGRNQVLGGGALLGTRIWDQQGRFEVNLGPMGLNAFLDFLPRGSAFEPLCELTRFYAGPQLEFSFRLTLRAAEVPGARLGRSWLGWTSYLNTRGFTKDDSQVRLASRTPADPFARYSMESVLRS